MSRKLTVLGLAALVLLAGTAMASTAFTTATVDRDANIGVQSDEGAVVQLAPGNVGAASVNASGALNVDAGSANGLNPAGSFTFGDAANPTATYAFNVTNAANDGNQHSYTVSYSQSAGTGTVGFQFFDDTGAALDTADNANDATFSLNNGETAFVVVTIDTDADLTDISGTLTITAD